MKSEERSPLPNGWIDDFMQKADLDASFRALDGSDHFHAATMRGRIRTLQLRSPEAWSHFDEAEAGSARAEETIANLRRTFVLQVYRFDNALLEAPESSKELDPNDPSFASFPTFSPVLLKEFPELGAALRMRTRVHGSYLLHAGRSNEALQVFTGLVEDRGLQHKGLAQAYMSIACCHYNLGNEEETERYLQSAELAVHACEELLPRAHLCGLLYAVHVAREADEQATEWKDFLFAMDCPQATKDTFFAWGEKVIAMSRESQQLVIF